MPSLMFVDKARSLPDLDKEKTTTLTPTDVE